MLPDRCPPVARYPLIKGGIAQCTSVTTRATRPRDIALHETSVIVSGVSKKGISKMGFRITGKPNNIISFMLKSANTPPILAMLRIYRLLAIINTAMMMHSDVPAPPINTKVSRKPLLIMSSCSLKAS